MIVVYDSRTNNVKRFVNKLKENFEDIEIIKIYDGLIIKEKHHLITYTTGVGNIPKKTSDYLVNNHNNVITISTSGNMNWGVNYGLALEKILIQYPNIIKGIKFEMSGLSYDIEKYIKILKEKY